MLMNYEYLYFLFSEQIIQIIFDFIFNIIVIMVFYTNKNN